MTRGEEQVLVERAAAGDKAAAEAFIRAHQGSLYAYLLRLSGKPELAEDIVQEAFVRVLTNLDRFDPRFRFSTWLFTIAKRLYVNACQRHKPAYDSDTVGGWQGGGEAPEAGAIGHEQDTTVRDAVQAALLALPTEQREVVVLFHQLDWPIWLIAQHLDMPEGTVKSHLHRGRKKMRVLLNTQVALVRRVGEVIGVQTGTWGGAQ
jgi:RNA polymerase sigma-70 factor (ECF subfamily)